MNTHVPVLARGERSSRRSKLAALFAVGAAAALVAQAGITSAALPATAAQGDTYRLNSGTVNIDGKALYAGSGGRIYQINTGNKSAKSIAYRARPYYWASNLGLGPDARDKNKLAFMSSAWNRRYPQVYRTANGSNVVQEVGKARQSPNRVAWGGGAVDPNGMYWQGTNLASAAKTRISRFNPLTGETVVSGRLVAPASDRIWNGNGQVAPDYTFDVNGNFYGVIAYHKRTFIYKFDVSNFSEGAQVNVQQVLEVKRLPKRAGSYYGLAWSDGKWYMGEYTGRIFSVDPATGGAQYEMTIPRTGNSGSYYLEDLASAALVPENPGQPGLQINKSASSKVAAAGENVNYTVTVRNSGGKNLEPATFQDNMSQVLNNADYQNDARASVGTVRFTGNQLSWSGNLGINDTATITYSVKVREGTTVGTQLKNSVRSTTEGSNCSTGNEAGCTTTTTVDELKVDVKKTTDIPRRIPLVQMSELNYTLTYKNDSRNALSVDEVDDMSRVLDDADIVTNPESSNSALQVSSVDSNGRFTIKGNLQPGQEVKVTYTVRVKLQTERGDNRLVNFVMKSGDPTPATCERDNNRCTVNTAASLITG